MTEAPVRQLHECWTCRGRTFCEISHSSSHYENALYRCVNCKAIYPDIALATRPTPSRDALVEHAATAEQVQELLSSRMPLLNWTVTPMVPGADQSGG